MVDVSGKPETARTAVAEGFIRVSEAVLAAVRANALKKGDALATARVAGIMAVKNTSRTIPLCHDIPVSACGIDLALENGRIRATCRVTCAARTGAEMEALSGVSAALLTLYDMAKSIDKDMEIGGVRLLSTSGGASGDITHAPAR
jgi:cyclic pyranopterin phosphate synthase